MDICQSLLKFGIVGGMLVLSATVSGCGSLGGSYPVGTPSTHAIAGAPYQLPKALLRLEAVRTTEGVEVRISLPIYVGDESSTYLLSYTPSEAAADKFKLMIDTSTMLLTSFNGEADDKTADAIRKLTTGSVMANQERGLSEQSLFAVIFDPYADNLSTISQELNQAVFNGLSAQLSEACETDVWAATSTKSRRSKADLAKIAKAEAVARDGSKPCRAQQRLKMPGFVLSLKYSPVRLAKGVGLPCSVGVCTRSLAPAIISGSDGHSVVASTMFMMPNGGSPIPVDLKRVVFTKATYDLVFKNGIVESVDRTKGSELLSVASLPLDVFRNVLTSTSQILQLQIALSGKEKELLAARQQQLEAKIAYDKAIKEAGEKAEGATENGLDDTMLVFTLPGFGRGSGFELPDPNPVKETPSKTTRPPSSKPATPDGTPPEKNENVLGGPVSEGSDGEN